MMIDLTNLTLYYEELLTKMLFIKYIAKTYLFIIYENNNDG